MPKQTCAAAKTSRVMREFQRGTLRSGRGGGTATNRKQAVAIALSEARKKCGPRSVAPPPRKK